jgi:hypothetical protein
MAIRLPSNLTYNDLNGEEVRQILTDWFQQLLAAQPNLQRHLTLPNAKIGLEVAITVDMYIGGSVPVASDPEQLLIRGGVELTNNVNAAPATQTFSTTINAAPIPGGNPPDQLREQHGLPTPTPGYGDRATGSHLFLGDVNVPPQQPFKTPQPPVASGGRAGIVADGYIFSDESVVSGTLEQSIAVDKGRIEVDLTGQGRMKQGGMVVTAGTHRASSKESGDQKGAEYGSVSGTYDAGPAGLSSHRSGGGLYSDGRSRIRFGNNH